MLPCLECEDETAVIQLNAVVQVLHVFEVDVNNASSVLALRKESGAIGAVCTLGFFAGAEVRTTRAPRADPPDAPNSCAECSSEMLPETTEAWRAAWRAWRALR